MRTRRALSSTALLASVGLTLASLASPVQAIDPHAVVGALGPQASFDGAGTCFVGGDPDATTSVAIDSNGQPVTATAGTSGVLVAPGDPPDTTKLSARSTVSGVITESFGHLVHAHLDLVGTAQANALVGRTSICHGAAGAISNATFTTALSSPALLRIRATASPGVRVLSTQITDGANTLLIDASLGTPGVHERVVFAPAGTYVFTVAALVLAAAPTTGSAHRAKARGVASYDISYRDVGTAIGAARGTGRSYVTTPAARSCLTDSLATQLTAKARRVRSAVFSVNGAVVRTMHDPKAGSLVLHDLPETRDVALSVALELAHHRTASLHRTYYRCG